MGAFDDYDDSEDVALSPEQEIDAMVTLARDIFGEQAAIELRAKLSDA